MLQDVFANAGTFIKEAGALFLSAAVGSIRFRHLTPTYRLVYAQVLLAVVAYLGAYAILEYQSQHQQPLSNHWIYNLYIPLEGILLLLAARSLLNDPRLRQIVVGCVVSFVTIYSSEVFFDGFKELLNVTLVASGLLIVLSFMLVLYSAIRQAAFDWKTSPEFSLAVGTIVYFACNAPFIGLLPFLLRQDQTIVNGLFYITEVLAVLRYLAVAASFYLVGRQTT